MDDSGQCGSALCRGRAKRRIFQSLASCKPSTSAGTGTPKAAAAIAIAYTYEESLSRFAQTRGHPRALCERHLGNPAFFDHPRERPLEIGKRRQDRRLTRVDNDVPSDRHPFRAMQAESRPESSFDAVTDNRSAKRSRHGEPKAHSCCIVAFARQAKRGEQGTGDAGAVIIDRSEVGGAQNTGTAREPLLAAGAGFNGRSGQLVRR